MCQMRLLTAGVTVQVTGALERKECLEQRSSRCVTRLQLAKSHKLMSTPQRMSYMCQMGVLTPELAVQVTGALERKEGLAAQVRQMSEEAGSGKHMDENGGHSETFQQAYAKAVLELRKVDISCPIMLLQALASSFYDMDYFGLRFWLCCADEPSFLVGVVTQER